MSYKYELHCHTGCTSQCGKVEPERIVELYKKHGYNGIVATDHYSPLTFMPSANGSRHTEHFLEGYRRMKAVAGDDFTILLGMEHRHYGTANDYLIYGITEEFMYNCGNLLFKSEKQIKKMCEENCLLVYQAHPFRHFITRCNPNYLDGVEVYNGKTPDYMNEKALKWAKKHGKLMISGSDFHSEEHVARGGIITEKPIKNNDDLMQILKKGEFTLAKAE